MASRTGTLAALAATDSIELVVALSRCVIRVTVGLLVVLFTILLIRHQIGMFQQPIPAGGLISVGILLALLFAWFHGVQWQQFTESRLTLIHGLAWCLPLLLSALVTLSLSLPGSSPTALAIMWSLLGTSEAGWTTAMFIARHRQRTDTLVPVVSTATVLTNSSQDLRDHLDESLESSSAELIQQMTRRLRTDGGESIQASTQASFASGQRTTTVHLAFCPPLEKPPVIECHQLDGPPCRIKTAEAEVYGARFELRLRDRCPDPSEVHFQIEATSSAPVT